MRNRNSPARLRWLLGLLLLALALPSAVLVWQTQQQLRFESLHQYRTLAEEMATRIDLELQRLIAREEARAVGEYRFLMVAGNPASSNLVQRSPLSQLPADAGFPGVLGHFVIDAQGRFSTPLLPDEPANEAEQALDAAELARRVQLRTELLEVLAGNQLVARHDVGDSDALALAKEVADKRKNLRDEDEASASYSGQAAFDRLNSVSNAPARQSQSQLGRVDELKLDRAYAEAGKKDQSQSLDAQALSNAGARGKRVEQAVALDEVVAGDLAESRAATARVRLFESEVDPFEFSLLASGHGVLFRRVWQGGERTIQGVLIDQKAFIDGVIARAFGGSALWQMSDLVVAWQQDVLQLIPGERARQVLSRASEVRGELLYQTRLSAPLDRLQLIWSVRRLPAGAGAQIVWWASAVLFAGLIGGFWLLYRLGLRQILLARQQQDFVSAVSHELKTPLTSIRMYAEMLQAGWASEDKKRSYYDFIFDESERLSRLIANVLQLARMERSDFRLDLKPLKASELIDLLRAKVHSQIERAGFAVEYRTDPGCAELTVAIDTDACSQILINLVDNAIKFSQSAPEHRIEISAAPQRGGLLLSVRDYGPGVPAAQLRKIFQLFYRAGDELTRESLGTGIGLALVRQLARAMRGDVDAVNRNPGAEFRLWVPGQGAAG
jgi:signal transduction histidine kinase